MTPEIAKGAVLAGLFLCLATSAGAQAPSAIWQIGPDAITSLRERPLFSPTRRAQQAPPQVSVGGPQAGDNGPLALVGVIRVQGGASLAILQSASGDIVRLGPGESYQGWEVVDIFARSVSLRSPTGLHEASLPDPASGPLRSVDHAPTSSDSAPMEGVPAYPAPVVKMP